jgi:copper chaperone
MELITYKTNIRSEAALDRVAPHLNKVVGSANWQLDITDTDKVLTVYSPGIVNETALLKAVRKAGFKARNQEDYYAVC